LLLVLALMQISAVVQDRQTHRQAAINSIAQSLAGPQTLTGPLIHRACTEEWDTLQLDKRVQTERREFHLTLAPASLSVAGGSELQARARGLHATQVFKLKAVLTAQWPDLTALEPVAQHTGSRLSCGQPLLMLSVSDARGIRHASLKLGGPTAAQAELKDVALKAGTFYGSYPRGVHAALPAALVLAEPLQAVLALELVGTEQLAIVPMGSDTQVRLTSNWPHPSFGGQFLPVERTVTDQGFEASWRISSLASSAQHDVAQKKAVAETLSVTFVDPGNTYALSDRATKYGLLFVGLSFLAVGLFEFMKSLRVHPVQYLLVGSAVCIFFLLLVSLSEHLPFGLAYGLAAAACVLLLMYYACYMLKSWWRGLPFGLGIGALYGMLFVLLQMEQTALVLGAITLFGVLSAVMLLTRHVDWYARFERLDQADRAEKNADKGSTQPGKNPPPSGGAGATGGAGGNLANGFAGATVKSSARFCD
jgi:inner membrane protein